MAQRRTRGSIPRHTPARPFAATALIAALLLSSASALAQSAAALRADTLGRRTPTVEMDATAAAVVDPSGPGERMGWLDYRADLALPLWQRPEQGDLTLNLSARHVALDTDAVLPDTGGDFPGDLYDLRVGLSARRAVDSGMVGLGLGLGSASDRPFDTADEIAWRAGAFWLLDPDEVSSWLFSLYYDSDGPFGGVPLPGVAWRYNPDQAFRLTLGAPFSMVYWRPLETWDFTVAASAPLEASARARWWINRRLALYGGYKIGGDSFLRHDRLNEDDRLSYFGQQTHLGLRWDLGDHVGLDLRGGWAFQRYWYEGESFFSDRHDNRIDLADGPFAALSLNLSF